MKELNFIIAENITRLRIAKQLTQLELGNLISYSDKSVSKWERGDSIPDAYVLKKLSELFGVSIDFLFAEHSDEEFKKKPVREHKHDRNVITLIVILGIWTLALSVFIILDQVGITAWTIFAYTVPVSLITFLILNSIWGNKHNNLFVISALLWSVLGCIYMTFFTYFTYNIWLIFALGLPAQVIIYFSFNIKKKQK